MKELCAIIARSGRRGEGEKRNPKPVPPTCPVFLIGKENFSRDLPLVSLTHLQLKPYTLKSLPSFNGMKNNQWHIRWMSRPFLILVMISLVCDLLLAQNSQISTYTLKDGVPQSQVYDVIQDDMGYLWLGTQGGGIARFDGVRFKVWNEREGLLSNYVDALAFSNDSLFIGTRQGLSIKTKQAFINFPCPKINKIVKIQGQLFLLTQSGIYQYQEKIGLTQIGIAKFLRRGAIYDLNYDGRNFWLATSKGLLKLDKLEAPSVHEELLQVECRSIVSHQDRVFVASFNKGVFVYNAEHQLDTIITKPKRINSMNLLNEHQLWIATDDSGVVVLDADELSIPQYLGKTDGLSVLHIRKCIKDKQANIWLATSGGGLYKYAQNNFKHYDRSTGLPGNRIYAVHEVNDGIWISNSEAGLVKIDTIGRLSIQDSSLLRNVKIKTISSDSEGNIWAGSEGKGIFVLGRATRDSITVDTSITPVRIDTVKIQYDEIRNITLEDGLSADWIRKIDIQGSQVWIATYSNGMMRFEYDFALDSIYEIKRFGRRDGIEDLLINDMRRDSLGRLWYATKKGHLGYIQKDKVRHFGQILDYKVDIGSLLFHEGALYLGTSGRGIWWSKLDESLEFEALSGAQELHSNNIYQLIFDGDNHLWVGSESGVDKVVLNSSGQVVEIFHYGRNDGFLGIETCLNAVTKDAMGNLWFGTIYGLTQYQPLENTRNYIKPILAFEDIEVVYKSLDSININEWSKLDKRLFLSPKENHLAFRYRTVDINNPEEIQYRWRLNQEAWSPWTSENAINFPRLTYGNYSFEAQSRNRNPEESEIIDFKFNIAQPLLEKTWFRRTVAAGLGLIFLMIVGGYIQSVKKKSREEQERLQMENHLLSLEQKALRLQMNPHFVFNVLNGIKSMGTHEPDKMNVTINKFATLLRAILNNSREDFISLEQEIQTLKNYIEVEQLMSTKPFSFEILVAEGLDPEEVMIPPMLVQPFVENAIRHGIMAVKREGILKINFFSSDPHLFCTIEDNGIGINTSQKNKKATDHQSLALSVTKERIESMSGKDALQVKEILNSDSKLGGTRVEFKLPLTTDY